MRGPEVLFSDFEKAFWPVGAKTRRVANDERAICATRFAGGVTLWALVWGIGLMTCIPAGRFWFRVLFLGWKVSLPDRLEGPRATNDSSSGVGRLTRDFDRRLDWRDVWLYVKALIWPTAAAAWSREWVATLHDGENLSREPARRNSLGPVGFWSAARHQRTGRLVRLE